MPKDSKLNGEVGSRIRQARESRKFTRPALCKLIGLKDQSALVKIEKGQNTIQLPQLVRAAMVLGVTTDYLLLGGKAPKPVPMDPGVLRKSNSLKLPVPVLRMLETPSSHRVVTNEGLAAAVEQAQRGVQDPVLVEQAMLGCHAIELRRHPPDPEAQERMKHWNRELDRRQVKSDEV